MKKSVKKTVATCMSVLFTTLAITCIPEISAIIYYGDANSDGFVDKNDIILLQEYFTNQSDTQPNFYASDMDDDNDVDIWDIIHLKRLIIYGVYPGESPTEHPLETTAVTTVAVTTTTTTTSADSDSDKSAKEYALKVVELVNQERAAAGVAPIEFNEDLFKAAMIRAEEITESFSHTRPDGTSFFTILNDIGYDAGYSGENIATGSNSAEAVINQWINSPNHYENIINPDFTQLGVGFVYAPDSTYRYYWVQIFTS